MSYELIQGDILASNETLIAHQCNCITTKGKGLSKQIFEKYPYANVYKNANRIPGEISISDPNHSPRVVAIFGQNCPGFPKGSETPAMREKWFYNGLTKLGEWMNKNSQTNIGFPFKIGCGLANGNWSVYERMLKEFAETYGVNVKVYIL